MWRVSWQDYRGWRTRDLVEPRPELEFHDYPDKAEADRRAERLKAAGMTVCVAPTPPPRRNRRRPRFTPAFPIERASALSE